MRFFDTWISERCSFMTELYSAISFTVSRKVPCLLFKVFTMATLGRKSSRWPRKERFCLLRKKITSIVIQLMALSFVHSLSMISCIPLPTAWWFWSRSVNSYHLFEQSLRTLEFSWSNKRGFKSQKVLKGLQTNKQSFSDWNNL